jgi:hypothetical protein
MYFDDIYKKMICYWANEFTITAEDLERNYIKELAINRRNVNAQILKNEFDEFDTWDEMVFFTMYQMYTEVGLYRAKHDGNMILSIDDISMEVVEKKFKDNLDAEKERFKEYIEVYKGLRG